MPRDIILTIAMEASTERIITALTTREGLAGFWTPKVAGEPGPGGSLRFGFATAPVDLEVTVRTADAASGRVEWDCHGPWPHWEGTTISWALLEGDPPRVLFAHRGWVDDQPEVELGFVAQTWAMVLQALKANTESGVPAPALS